MLGRAVLPRISLCAHVAWRHNPRSATGCPLSRYNSSTSPPATASAHQKRQNRTLAVVAPEVAAQWHPTKNGDTLPSDIVSGTHTKYWWKCEEGPDHEWEASPRYRVGMGVDCPCCAGRQVSVTNSLASVAPEVAAQWHPTKNGDTLPTNIVSGTHTKYWWKCEEVPDHEWEASPSDRVSGRRRIGCPHCAMDKMGTTDWWNAGEDCEDGEDGWERAMYAAITGRRPPSSGASGDHASPLQSRSRRHPQRRPRSRRQRAQLLASRALDR